MKESFVSGKQRICLVSDFFFPNFGGVETHIWCLAQCLLQRGLKVIVLTHSYQGRSGVRYMTNGLKVYYLPVSVCFDQVVYSTLFSFFCIFRNIVIREKITIVHGHQSVSVMTHECLLYARALGLRTCFTDHSLFGFADPASIQINKMLEITLSDVDHVICVSHTCRENLSLRAKLHPSLVSTIPNAVDATKFTPDITKLADSSNSNSINIVVLSRLVFRKGIDLLVKVIPAVCSRNDQVKFIIGGDGPKLLLLEEMRERYQLHERVEFLGAIAQHDVRDVLVRGNIFLNCSLTESFCIALLEAASCGLFVVSTKVGGVPEVLPPSMIRFAEPVADELVEAVLDGVALCRRLEPSEFHDRISNMYNWIDVSRRVETVYNHISTLKRPTLIKRLMRYMTSGRFSGVVVSFVVVLMEFMRFAVDFIFPASDIEVAPDINLDSERLNRKDVKHKTSHGSPRKTDSAIGLGE